MTDNNVTEVTILLNSVDKVKRFANKIYEYPVDCDISSGNYIIDGKSIMGIFSLDVSKPLTLKIHQANADLDKIREFML